jgi:DNA invertase Pin-like site-specific DNA recombinase
MAAPTATPRPRRPRRTAATPAPDTPAVAALRARAVEHNQTLPADAPVVDLYARLSKNDDGDLETIETQLGDALDAAIRNVWRVAELHIDNSLSAWNPKVRRPGWEALLERLQSGACDGVVGYHFDRLLRRPQDLGRLLDIVRQRELKFATAHGSRRDLSDTNDQFIAWVEVAHAQRSSDDTSRRIQRKFRHMRESGVVRGGPRWFGFPGADRAAPKSTDGAPRPPVPAEQVERERNAIRDACKGIDAGITLAEIAKTWNEAGLRTATGGTWDGVNVRQVLARPRNAGLIHHKGQLVGHVTDEEPIVDEELHQRVQAVFAGRRRGRAPDTRNYVATGLIYCGVCGNPLTGRPRARHRPDGTQVTEYYCFKLRGGCGRLCVDARGVDAVLRAWTVRRLSDPAHAEQVQAAAAEDHKRLDEVTAELAQARMVEAALAERLGRGEIGLEAWEVGNKHAHDRVARLQVEREALAAKATDPTDPELAASHEQAVADDWDHDAAVNGTLRRALLTRALRGVQVVVEPRPHQKGKPVFDPERVRITPARNA